MQLVKVSATKGSAKISINNLAYNSLTAMFVYILIKDTYIDRLERHDNKYIFYLRYDECRSPSSSGAWLPNAVSTELSRGALRDYVGVLAQGSTEEAHV